MKSPDRAKQYCSRNGIDGDAHVGTKKVHMFFRTSGHKYPPTAHRGDGSEKKMNREDNEIGRPPIKILKKKKSRRVHPRQNHKNKWLGPAGSRAVDLPVPAGLKIHHTPRRHAALTRSPKKAACGGRFARHRSQRMAPGHTQSKTRYRAIASPITLLKKNPPSPCRRRCLVPSESERSQSSAQSR